MIDKQDLSAIVQQQQQGISDSFWPIRISPSTLGQGGTPLALNQEVEINITPCDHIFLPSRYDKSYGVNPGQLSGFDSLYSPDVCGENVSDVPWMTGTPVVNKDQYVNHAPIFGLKFNSPNNPWLLWSLSSLLHSQPSGAAGNISTPYSTGGAMRSISGPISRMWVRFYQWAIIAGATNRIAESQVVLLSMLGYSQQTPEQAGPGWDLGSLVTQPISAHGSGTIAGGGYITPQLNTLERLQLGDRGTSKPTLG